MGVSLKSSSVYKIGPTMVLYNIWPRALNSELYLLMDKRHTCGRHTIFNPCLAMSV